MDQKILVAALYRVTASPITKISPQEAEDNKYFGPVYHGSDEHLRQKIAKEGFKIHIDDTGGEGISHGYPISHYAHGKPPPVHHLGFGVYFTTVLAIAKSFNNDSIKGLKQYYIDAPRLAEINFGSPNTMMEWWVDNGYDMPSTDNFSGAGIRKQRLEATINMTNELKSKYDAVWYKGKGLRKLLDGDQIVAFDTDIIYEVDPKLAKGFEKGAKVKRKSDGMVGIIKDQRKLTEDQKQYHQGADMLLSVKWKKGGTDGNVKPFDIEPF